MNPASRLRTACAFAGYVLVAVVVCLLLSRLASRITAAHLLDQAQQQLARVQAHEPLWAWHLHKPHDLVAGHAFGHAQLAREDDALRITSSDGEPFELGLPVAWSLDLHHWPILEIALRSSAPGTLGVVWQSGNPPGCLSKTPDRLTPDTRSLRIDLRDMAWQGSDIGDCSTLGSAQMLRLRIQIPAQASVTLASVQLLTTEPMQRQEAVIDLPGDSMKLDLAALATRVQNEPMPLFRLPGDSSAETMLALRDQLRARWPAALIAPADTTPHAEPPAINHPAVAWAACIIYLLVLACLVWRPVGGSLGPWVELIGCLLGPLWLIAGLHWGLRPTALGLAAFGGGLVYALAIERRHVPRLWRWPASGRDWMWPLATALVTIALILACGHALHPLPLSHVFVYFGWAWLQQWLMLVVLLHRFERIVHRANWAIVAVAVVFALLHTPNGMLMQLCFVGELGWAWCFLRGRSVLPIALAHAICALLVESGLAGGTLLRSLEVSARFFF
ncbi:CPBP family intramembrane metalloprotease [Dyella monticola]|uniref:CPBP family intramembrane metalloprotease n=1 Tax=Dyella monticola TaxID=1927958 RepID=A0A370WV70_9GAMM|nr:CPBP family glutamic-type intramembrane protease [Dyella monticola]RDS79951.1 CPBP family intramembrane metalloprotease [Dyella monticola]